MLVVFECNVLDYLFKFIVLEWLEVVLVKVCEWLCFMVVVVVLLIVVKGVDDMVFLCDGECCWFVCLGDIVGFEVCGNYV